MDNRRRLLPDGGGEPNLSVSTVRAEHVCERVKRDAGDPVTSTRAAKEDTSGVPCKVPRFQYVDFPSLHQCIKQLSVPPLEGWLASCPLTKAPACQPSDPKERVPKFKYVDYPSLYHCIQQLSVPPVEIWSSGLTRPSPGRQSPSQSLGDQRGSGEARRALVAEQPRHAPPGAERGGGGHSELDNVSWKSCGPGSSSRGESGSRAEAEGKTAGDETAHRPSVISMAHGTGRKHSMVSEERVQRVVQRVSSDTVAHRQQQAAEESFCLSGGRMLMDPEELQSQRCTHKGKRPH